LTGRGFLPIPRDFFLIIKAMTRSTRRHASTSHLSVYVPTCDSDGRILRSTRRCVVEDDRFHFKYLIPSYGIPKLRKAAGLRILSRSACNSPRYVMQKCSGISQRVCLRVLIYLQLQDKSLAFNDLPGSS